MNAIPFSWRPSIVMYSHDGFGLGHLSRTVYLARCIREQEPGADIVVLTSSAGAHRYAALADFEYIKLPSVTKIGDEHYHPHNLKSSLDSVLALRADLLLTTVQHVQPDLLIVDHRPLGLRQEALPTLEWVKRHSPRTRTVVGLRDVVDDPDIVKSTWQKQQIYDALERLYDEILVYGDRSVLDITTEYALPESTARKVRFTGYLGRTVCTKARERARNAFRLNQERLIVVHAGGGGDGVELIETYLRALPRLPGDVFSLVVTGPLMERRDVDRLRGLAAGPHVRLVDYQDNLADFIAAADLSLSMGGYNTVCEILSSSVRALVVPRVFPRSEQHIRAERLAARGLLGMLHPASVNPQTLSAAIHAALRDTPHEVDPVPLDGGTRAASIFTSLLADETQETRREPAAQPVGINP